MYILLGDGFFIFQNTWSIAFRYDTVDGGKVHYRCNKVKLAGPQCPAAIYLLYHSEKESVSLFRTDDEHDHSIAVPSTRGLAPEIRIAMVFVRRLRHDASAFMGRFDVPKLVADGALQLPDFYERIHMQAFAGSSHSRRVLRCASNCSNCSDWPEAKAWSSEIGIGRSGSRLRGFR